MDVNRGLRVKYIIGKICEGLWVYEFYNETISQLQSTHKHTALKPDDL